MYKKLSISNKQLTLPLLWAQLDQGPQFNLPQQNNSMYKNLSISNKQLTLPLLWAQLDHGPQLSFPEIK